MTPADIGVAAEMKLYTMVITPRRVAKAMRPNRFPKSAKATTRSGKYFLTSMDKGA